MSQKSVPRRLEHRAINLNHQMIQINRPML